MGNPGSPFPRVLMRFPFLIPRGTKIRIPKNFDRDERCSPNSTSTYTQNGLPLALHLPLVFSASLMQFGARNVFLQKPHMHNTAAAIKVIIDKLLIFGPIFFSVLPTGPKPAENQPKSQIFHTYIHMSAVSLKWQVQGVSF